MVSRFALGRSGLKICCLRFHIPAYHAGLVARRTEQNTANQQHPGMETQLSELDHSDGKEASRKHHQNFD